MFTSGKTRNVSASGTTGDPYWSNVSLLTNFENNLSFLDESTNNFPIVRTGVVNPSLATPFTGVGGSLKFLGTSNANLSINSTYSASFPKSTENATFEACIYLNALGVNQAIISKGSTSSLQFYLSISNANVITFGSQTGGSITGTTALTTGVWYHVAATCGGGTAKIWLNGVQEASGSVTLGTYTNLVYIGALSPPTGGPWYWPFNGFISNARISNLQRYSSTFTPVTTPFTPDASILLLITGTGQGMFDNSTFVDQGPNALTVTATGAPVYSGLSPFGNTYPGSVYFGGDGNYLSAPPAAATSFSGAFTMEAWINVSDAGRTVDAQKVGTVFGGGVALNTTNLWAFYLIISGGVLSSLGLEVNGVNILTSSALSAALNTWHHVALARNGTTLTFYLNGTSVGSTTYSSAFSTNTGGTVQIARFPYGSPNQNWTKGYFSNARVVNGTAVYTANFTPSTTPLTAITNTSLLVRGDTGAFYDLSNVGNPESGVGSVAVTTQVKKFGNESGSFNGTTSYLTAPDNISLNMGAADFTLEAWIYLTATPGAVTNNGANVINKDGKAAVSWAQYNLYVNSALKVCASFSSVPNAGGAPTANITGSTTLSLNTWYYVAVTRSGVNGTVWVNGVSNGTTASIPTTLANGARALYIGYEESQPAFAYFPGYIDDIRITKGVARTITTPTATFPTGL